MTSPPTVLFNQRRPWYYVVEELYDPDIHGVIPVDQLPQRNLKIAEVDSLVKVKRELFFVATVDPITYKYTLTPARIKLIDEESDISFSVVSYRNDIFRAYYDIRNAPTRIQPDARLVVYGTSVAKYQIIKNANTPNEKIISRYYDTDGNFTDNRIPMIRIDSTTPTASWTLQHCHTTDPLINNENLVLRFFNDYGAEIAEVTCFAKESVIMNESPGYMPVIVGMDIISTQYRGGDEHYIYETQDPDSLMIRARLHYDDGHYRDVDVDSQKCYVYGIDDFIAGYSGLRQPFLVKYYLSPDEIGNPNILDPLGKFISKPASLIVVPNELASPLKVSVIPIWSPNIGRYLLKYYAYTTDRTQMYDVTQHTAIIQGTFTGNFFGSAQDFVIETNMTAYDPTAYPPHLGGAPHKHVQNVVVKIQNPIAPDRYLIKDTLESALVYGTDSIALRRPNLKYDSVRNQYFVSTSMFPTKEKFLQAFYYNASPPYLPASEDGPLEPTHFIIRELNNGGMIIPDPIAIDDYETAFNVINPAPGAYLDKTILFEFLLQLNTSTTLVLYGAPLECTAGTYVGP